MARLAGVVLLACALAGCRDGGRSQRTPAVDPQRTPEAAFREQLGRTWELANLGGQPIEQKKPPAPAEPGRHPGIGSRPTIRFTAEPATEPRGTFQAGGWSFCNGYGTSYRLGPDGALTFHFFESTLVGCDGPDSLETRFSRALHLTRRVELDSGTLVLIAADSSRLTFVPAPPAGSASQ